MKSTNTMLTTAAFAVLVAGCANGPQEARREYTHEWVAGNRVAELHFAENNQSCASAAGSVSGYEQCMADKGYRRSDH
jgi:hypothetical protein